MLVHPHLLESGGISGADGKTDGFNTKPPKAQVVSGGSSFYRRYKTAILFNRNLLISGAAGFFSSAYVSQLHYQLDKNEFANSVVALATEYAVYLPLFAVLYYADNRQRYVDPVTGRKDRKQIRTDIKGLFASFSVSEVIFSIARIASQYGLLQLEVPAFEASMISSFTAWAAFFVSINFMARLTRLFHR
jgi:hypothetical protein